MYSGCSVTVSSSFSSSSAFLPLRSGVRSFCNSLVLVKLTTFKELRQTLVSRRFRVVWNSVILIA